ncbi:hypothetical protein [Aureliella helgolandensis]|nr:hypothetical protein [Aureliella helgolandensis]
MLPKTCFTLTTCCLMAVPLAPLAIEPPHIVAHRGLLLHAPENTLANFRACLERVKTIAGYGGAGSDVVRWSFAGIG